MSGDTRNGPNTMKTIDEILPIYNCGYCANDETCEDCLEKRDSLKQALSTMVEEIIHPAMLNDSIYQRQLELAADRGFTMGVSND